MTRRNMRKYFPALVLGIAMTAMLVYAQEQASQEKVTPNPSYDGRYAFARLSYTAHSGDPCTCLIGKSTGAAGWMHDYPDADRNLMRIATALTSLNAAPDSTAVFKADDPALMKYPILYLTEPACWHPSDAEVRGLRTYLLKGGFLIVDDFMICSGGPDRAAESKRAFEEQIQRILPNSKIKPVDLADPLLSGFFELKPRLLKREFPRLLVEPPEVHAIFENNDSTKRMMVVANYNSAIHRLWAWQKEGKAVVKKGSEGYKLGVNYLLYGFTH